VNQADQQLASLEVYAKEISVAYGIKQKLEGPADITAEGTLSPTFAESVEEYNFLRSANALAMSGQKVRPFGFTAAQPTIWPVDGRLLSAFGARTDPFSGEGAFHSGVDIAAVAGTPVHVTADGIVVFSQTEAGYGKLVVVDHGGGLQTYYAHLSRFFVQTGETIRRGTLVGAVGSTGRVTAPHLHYEVRIGGAPVNPYRYLAKSVPFQQSARMDFPF